MNFGDLNPVLNKIIAILTRVERNTAGDPCCVLTLTGGTASPIAEGFSTITITSTTGPTVITFPDATTYTLASNEVLTLNAKISQKLPALTIAGGVFKWVGTK